MDHLLFFGFLLISATLLALVEIQAEGEHGWGEKFPTWRVRNRLTRLLWGERPVTGYHLYLNLFVLVILHFPFAAGFVHWTGRLEYRVVAFLVLFWILEDFLWFVLNPAFGWRRFTREVVWWHAKNWWGFMPADYWVALVVGSGLYWMSV
jgi:hypothetical protein